MCLSSLWVDVDHSARNSDTTGETELDRVTARSLSWTLFAEKACLAGESASSLISTLQRPAPNFNGPLASLRSQVRTSLRGLCEYAMRELDGLGRGHKTLR